MPAGKLDTRVRFETRTGTQETALGTYAYTWAEVATVWADVQDVLPSRSESIEDGMVLQARPTRVRIRYRSDITSDMRVIIGGTAYRIIAGPAELGRRKGLELMCEVLTNEGVEP